MNFIQPQSLDQLCTDNIGCCFKGCPKKHPRVLAGVCIFHLINVCNDPNNCVFQHISRELLKTFFQNPPINGIYLFNICKQEYCQNSLCRYVHPQWKKLICWKCLDLDNENGCEAHAQEIHDLQWLRDQVYEEYNIQEFNPENLCTCENGTCKKKSHRLQTKNYCIPYFKGLCPLILCNKQHVKWEEFQKQAVQQNNQNQVIKPCIINDIQKKKFVKQQQTYSYHIFQPKRLQEELSTAIKEEKFFDIIFILDCTSSMQKWINTAKSSISKIMNEFKVKIPSNSNVRIAAVCYTDFDCQDHIKFHNFTTHTHLIENFIGKQSAKGGEDIPEDLVGALQKAYSLNISTNEQSLLNILIMTDAPCHGRQYHDLMWDEYSEHQEGKLEEILQKFKNLKSRLYVTFFNLLNEENSNKNTKKMEKVMLQELPGQFFTATIGEKQFADYVKFSLQASLRQESRQRLDNQEYINCIAVCEKQGEMKFSYDKTDRSQSYFEIFRQQLQQTKIITDTVLRVQKQEVQLSKNEQGVGCKIFKAFDTKKNTYIVLKIPKNIIENSQKLQQKDIEEAEKQALVRYNEQLIAQQLMTLFNSQTQNHQSLKRIIDPYFYSAPSLYRFNEPLFGLKLIYGETFINIENQEWTKHSNNYDWGSPEAQILAFSHFSFEVTNYELIITDIQGKLNLLSDPAVHTKKKNLELEGRNNFEADGIQQFFSSQHPKCNQVCCVLQLQRPDNIVQHDSDEETDIIPKILLDSVVKEQHLADEKFRFLICQNCGKQDELKTETDSFCKGCKEQEKNPPTEEECSCCKKKYFINYNLQQLQSTVKLLCRDCRANQCNQSQQLKCHYCNEAVCNLFEHHFKIGQQNIELCIDAVNYLKSLRCQKCTSYYDFKKLLTHKDFSDGKFECC